MRSWHWPTPGPRQKDRNWEREEDLPRLDRSPLAHTDTEKSVSDRRLESHPRIDRFRAIASIPGQRRPAIPTRRASEGRWLRPARDAAGLLAGASGWCRHERGPGSLFPASRLSARELVRIRVTCSGWVPRYGPSDRRPGAPTGERLRTFLHSDESGTAPSDVDGYPEVRGSAGVTSRAGEGTSNPRRPAWEAGRLTIDEIWPVCDMACHHVR